MCKGPEVGWNLMRAPILFSGNSRPQNEATALTLQPKKAIRLHLQQLTALKILGTPRMSFLPLICYNWQRLILSMFLRACAKAGISHSCWFKIRRFAED